MACDFLSLASHKSLLVSCVFKCVFDLGPEIRKKEKKFKSMNLGYFKSLQCTLFIQTNNNVLFKLCEIYLYLHAQNT